MPLILRYACQWRTQDFLKEGARAYIVIYRVVHKFCNNNSTVKLSAMKANISLFKPTIGKSRQFFIRLM